MYLNRSVKRINPKTRKKTRDSLPDIYFVSQKESGQQTTHPATRTTQEEKYNKANEISKADTNGHFLQKLMFPIFVV